jgi:hypothetical protein
MYLLFSSAQQLSLKILSTILLWELPFFSFFSLDLFLELPVEPLWLCSEKRVNARHSSASRDFTLSIF